MNPGKIAGMLSNGDINWRKRLISCLFNKAWHVFPCTVFGVYVVVPPLVVVVKHDSIFVVNSSSKSSLDFSNSCKKLGGGGEKCIWFFSSLFFVRDRCLNIFLLILLCHNVYMFGAICFEPFSCLRRVSCDVLIFCEDWIGAWVRSI